MKPTDYSRLVSTRTEYNGETWNHNGQYLQLRQNWFGTGVVMTFKVITWSQRAGRTTIPQPGNREWLTIIESIFWPLLPMDACGSGHRPIY